MATRGWQNVTAADVARMQQRQAPSARPSKYRNVKVATSDGEKFDSKREAAYWTELKALEHAGEITGLRRQVAFDLRAPCEESYEDGMFAAVVVAQYVCDFWYRDKSEQVHVVDAKGKRTAMYQLKKKWLELQSGIIIEEV